MSRADAAAMTGREPPHHADLRAWRALLLGAFALGVAVRLASVLARPHLLAGGDPAEYVGQANLLVEGKGWIEPLLYARTGAAMQTAKLPPLFTLVMAVCSLAGFKSFFAHRVWSAAVGSLAVPVSAWLGREVAGRKVGLLSSFGVALYPNLWMSDGLVMSETISPIMAMLVLWAGYRMWRQPNSRRAAVLGLAVGLAALARDELILLAAFVLLPLALGTGRRATAERLRLAGVGAAGVVLVLAPWVGFNISRFSHPVLITDRFGVTVAAANCGPAWHGTLRAYWSMGCADRAAAGVTGDESAVDPVALRRGLRYVSAHLGGLPVLELDRLGRTFGFYRPLNQLQLDRFVEGRPAIWTLVGLVCFYLLVPGAVCGAVILRRRGVPVFPLVAVVADIVVAVLLTYGQTRFRAPLEPLLVILASVAALSGLDAARRRFARGQAGVARQRSLPAPASIPPPPGPS